MRTDASRTAIFTAEEFWPAFERDIMSARNHIIIQSPFITARRLKLLSRSIRALAARGITVCVFAQEPRWWSAEDSELDYEAQFVRRELNMAIEMLQSWQVHVNLRKRIHAKLAVVDGAVLWEGSLNILSHAQTQEHMRRSEGWREVREAVRKHALLDCAQCKSGQLTYGTAGSMPERLSSLGRLLASRRKLMRLSQRELSQKCGLPHSGIQKIESGRNVTVYTLFHVAAELELEPLLIPSAFVPSVVKLLQKSADRPAERRSSNRRL